MWEKIQRKGRSFFQSKSKVVILNPAQASQPSIDQIKDIDHIYLQLIFIWGLGQAGQDAQSHVEGWEYLVQNKYHYININIIIREQNQEQESVVQHPMVELNAQIRGNIKTCIMRQNTAQGRIAKV